MQVFEAVHVLELGFGAQLSFTTATQAYISVTTKRTLFHGAVRNTNRQVNLAKLLHEQTSLFRRAQIWLRY